MMSLTVVVGAARRIREQLVQQLLHLLQGFVAANGFLIESTAQPDTMWMHAEDPCRPSGVVGGPEEVGRPLI